MYMYISHDIHFSTVAGARTRTMLVLWTLRIFEVNGFLHVHIRCTESTKTSMWDISCPWGIWSCRTLKRALLANPPPPLFQGEHSQLPYDAPRSEFNGQYCKSNSSNVQLDVTGPSRIVHWKKRLSFERNLEWTSTWGSVFIPCGLCVAGDDC